MKITRTQNAFTLFEVLLSISVVAIMSIVAIPVSQSFIGLNELNTTQSNLVRSLKNAQLYSMASYGDNTWGVAVLSSSIVLFKGTSYALRDTNADAKYSFSSRITSSGLSEIVFSKVYGAPSTIGSISFKLANNTTKTVTLNSKGILNY